MADEGIVLDGIRKSYPGPEGGTVQAVRGIDLTFRVGETVALLGPNGAGKSTTIDMVLGLAEPDEGSVRVFGASPAKAVDAGWVSAMFQSGALLRDLSVRELVALVASSYRAPLDVDVAIERAGITEFANRRTEALSGGQAQRVRFAMALVADPRLLVLDEPTVAMDVAARNEFWKTMRGVAAHGSTVLFATHYLEEAAAFADRVVLVANGQVVADGPVTEISGLVGGRIIRTALPGVDEAELAALPGVTRVERHGDSVALTCRESDAALRALLERYPQARDVEVASGGLEAAFLALTTDDATTGAVPA